MDQTFDPAVDDLVERETGKTPLFASESLVKSDGRGLSDFATGPSPFPDTPWQEAQD